ncbi:MAG: RND family transporter [Bacilli bacterium]|nr:RND family transporter [Bacilli bacterium]
MNKYTLFIFKHKKALIILLMLLNVMAIIGITKIRLNTDFSMFSPDVSIYQERLDELENTFGELSQIIVLVEHDTFTNDVIYDLREIQSNLEMNEHIVYVQGVAPESLLINHVSTSILDIPANEILTYYEAFGDFSPLKEADGVYYSTFTVFLRAEFNKTDVRDIEEMLGDYQYSSYVSGDSYNQLKISDYIIRILLMLPPLTILTILLVFRWQMGSFKPTFLSVLPAAIGSLWTFGLIGWIGNEVSILTAVVPIFIIVIGSADGLHFMSHYQDSRREGKDVQTGLNSTLRLVGIPMIVTTLTSMVGFISLLTMNTSSIFDLAVFSALGILLAGVATWYVLPLVLSSGINVLPKNTDKKHFDLSIYVKKIWGIPSLVIILIILIGSYIAIPYINNEFNMLMIYKDSTIVSVNADKVQEVNGGSIPIYVTIELDDSPITLASLSKVNALVNELNNLSEVSKIINPYQLMTIVYNMNTPGDIPNDMVLNMVYSNISNDSNSTIHSMISVDKNMVRLLVFPTDLTNDTLITIEETATNHADNVFVTGVQYLMKDLNVNISSMQIKSIMVALAAVLLMLIVTLKSVKIAFYSILPILITVVAVYGFLGLTGIPLNITTVIIFSITIGVGIDYAVHFSSVYKYYLKETNDNQLAIGKAYKNSSRPIITNALGISLGLSILMLSPLTIHFNVATLMWISMVVSVIITLTLLPFIFSLRKDKEGSNAKTNVL